MLMHPFLFLKTELFVEDLSVCCFKPTQTSGFLENMPGILYWSVSVTLNTWLWYDTWWNPGPSNSQTVIQIHRDLVGFLRLSFASSCLQQTGCTIYSNDARIQVLKTKGFFKDIIVDFHFYFGTTLSSFSHVTKLLPCLMLILEASLITRMILTQQNLLQVCFLI